MRSMYEDERSALRCVLFLVVASGVAAVLLYTPPPPPPPPPSSFQGLLALWTLMARLSPSSVPSASTAPATSGALLSTATMPSSAPSAAPSAASPSRRSTRSIGIAGRKLGASDVVEPWAHLE